MKKDIKNLYMKKVILLTLSIYIIMFSGCTAHLMDPTMNFKPPKYVQQMPSKQESNSYIANGSIYGQGHHPLFSDHKAIRVDDIVTVIISEQTQSSNKGTKALTKSNVSKLGGGIFTAQGANPAISAYANKLNGLTNIGFGTNSTSKFSGKGSSTQAASFTTTISARVIKIMQNGNYFIMGKREVMINDEKQVVEVSGVIRPFDIGQNNTINSNQISNAKILYSTQGDIDRVTNQGWGSKIIESIWPF